MRDLEVQWSWALSLVCEVALRASSVGRPVLPATVTAGISEPRGRANSLATSPVMDWVPAKVLPLSALFPSLTWEFGFPLLCWQMRSEACVGVLCKRSEACVGCQGPLLGAELDPPPASQALPVTGLSANGPAGSEYRERAEDALSFLLHLSGLHFYLPYLLAPHNLNVGFVGCGVSDQQTPSMHQST